MKKFYLDYNIFVNLMSDTSTTSFKSAIEEALQPTHIKVYSPAHIEEVAVSFMRHSYTQEGTHEKLRFISKLTNNYSLLPFRRGDVRIIHHDGIYLCEESPFLCYERVTADYSKNDEFESKNTDLLKNSESINYFDNTPYELNNTPPSEVLKPYKKLLADSFIASMKKNYGKNYSSSEVENLNFNNTKSNFRAIEALIEVAFNVLEIIRYFPENKENGRSRGHDISHAIYAAYCDTFISGDKRLIHKMLVAYQHLGISTNLIYLSYSKQLKTFTLQKLNS